MTWDYIVPDCNLRLHLVIAGVVEEDMEYQINSEMN